ncbi:MAG: ABC transporter ATP-binding protein, partial [Clostridiaceae bacterium]|nr:ABC transporter ATP-binding protein [Clostridiaceae bacterium]
MKIYCSYLKEFILVRKNLPYILGIILVVIVTTFCSFLTPALSKLVIDSISLKADKSYLNMIGILSLAIVLFSSFISITQGFLINKFLQRMALNIRWKFFKHLQNLSWDSYDKYMAGELQFRMFNDSSIIAENASLLPLNFGISLLFLIVINIAMIILEWKIAFFIDSLLIVNGLINLLLQKKMENYSKDVQLKGEQTYSLIQEQMHRLKLSQLYNANKKEGRKTLKSLRAHAEAVINKNIFITNSSVLIGIVSSLWSIGVLWIGGIAVINKSITLGDLVAFISITGLLMPLGNQIVNALIQYPVYKVSINRVYEIISLKPCINFVEHTKDMFIQKGTLEMKNISFSYNFGFNKVIDNLSISIKNNSLTAIVGTSGVGKSTLLKLMLRLYDPTEGSILIDSIDIKKYPLKSLRSQIGYVGNYSPVFSGTIYDNITYGSNNASFEEVEAAVALACIDMKIKSLPDGLFTPIGSKGIELSDGEKQRISLARCFLAKPKIILLDEVTSNLDQQTEEKILINLKKISSDSTVIF